MSLLSAQLDPEHWDRSYDKMFAAWQPKSVRIINPDKERIRRVLAVSPRSLIVLRNHALSEQHDSLARNPIAAANEHAARWNQLVNSYGVTNREQMIVLGINEPRVHIAGIPEATDIYSLQLMKECDKYNLRCGIYSFSTGWPGDTGQGPGSPVDWSPYKASLDYLEVHRNHFAMTHEYFCQAGPKITPDLKPDMKGGPWGWNPYRIWWLKRDVPIMIGETGMEELVCNPKVTMKQRGWKNYVSAEVYARMLLEYEKALSQDKRIHSAQIFILDGNSEWSSLWYHEVIPFFGTNTDFAWYVDQPAPPDTTLKAALQSAGRAAQTISLNPGAGLQRAIFTAGLVPVGNETRTKVAGVEYAVQRAESLSMGKGVTFYSAVPAWDQVYQIPD